MRITPVLLCVLFFAAPAWAQDCKLVQAASLPITMLGNTPTLNATLDGVPTPLAFSLGGENVPLNRLYKSFTDAHNFEIQRANFGNVYIVQRRNLSELSMATIHDFSLGPVKGTNMNFLIQPLDQPSPNLAGALLQSVLADFDFEFDLQGKKLNLFLQSHCPGQVVYWTASNIARLPFFSTDMDGRFQMELDGKPLRVLLAPNRPASQLGSKAFHRIFGLDLDSPGVERIAGSPDSNPLYSYHFSTLSMDVITIHNPSITIYVQKGDECLDKPRIGLGSRIESEQAPGCFGGQDLELGAPVLRQLHLFFANKEKMLYLTPASAH